MDIVVSNASDKPIYRQIVDQTRDQVLTGARRRLRARMRARSSSCG